MIRIIEMALSRKEYLDEFHSYSRTYLNHLVKIYFYRDSRYVDGDWIDEIYEYYGFVPEIKKNLTIRENDVFDAIYGWIGSAYKNALTNRIVTVNKKITEFDKIDIRKVDFVSLDAYVCEVSRWIAKKLSKDGLIDNEDLSNMIHSILIKYPLK